MKNIHGRKKLLERNKPFVKNGLRKLRTKKTLFIKKQAAHFIVIDITIHEKHILLLEFFYPLQRTGIFSSNLNNGISKDVRYI